MDCLYCHTVYIFQLQCIQGRVHARLLDLHYLLEVGFAARINGDIEPYRILISHPFHLRDSVLTADANKHHFPPGPRCILNTLQALRCSTAHKFVSIVQKLLATASDLTGPLIDLNQVRVG